MVKAIDRHIERPHFMTLPDMLGLSQHRAEVIPGRKDLSENAEAETDRFVFPAPENRK
jgi:hypothetical protein